MSCFYLPSVKIASRFELGCNPYDRIPLASSISGPIRLGFATIQIAVAPFFAALQLFQSLLDGRKETFLGTWEWAVFAMHGIANAIRGVIATIPILNLFLIDYDQKVGRLNYIEESIPRNLYPLNQ